MIYVGEKYRSGAVVAMFRGDSLNGSTNGRLAER